MATLDAEANEEQFGNDQPKSMSGPIIGIIYPPPEVRSILCQKENNLFSQFSHFLLKIHSFNTHLAFPILSYQSFNY